MTSIVQAIGAVASVLGIGTSLVAQGANIHRQLNPPQSQVQQQCQPPLYKLEVVIMPNGQRQLMCVQEAQNE